MNLKLKKILAREVLIFFASVIFIAVAIAVSFFRFKSANRYSAQDIIEMQKSISIEMDSIYNIVEKFMIQSFVVDDDTYDIPVFVQQNFFNNFPNALKVHYEGSLYIENIDTLLPNHISKSRFVSLIEDSLYIRTLYNYIISDLNTENLGRIELKKLHHVLNLDQKVNIPKDLKAFVEYYSDSARLQNLFNNLSKNQKYTTGEWPHFYEKYAANYWFFNSYNEFVNTINTANKLITNEKLRKHRQKAVQKIESIEKRKSMKFGDFIPNKNLTLIIISFLIIFYPIRLFAYLIKWAVNILRN